MKIKQTRQVRLDELISYIWKNKVESTVFESCKGKKVNVGLTGIVYHDPVYYFSKEDLFLIEEEIEITEETKLDLVDIYKDYGLPLEVAFCKNTSVKEILKLDKESKIDTRFIHLQNEDGSIGDLIWSKRSVE